MQARDATLLGELLKCIHAERHVDQHQAVIHLLLGQRGRSGLALRVRVADLRDVGLELGHVEADVERDGAVGDERVELDLEGYVRPEGELEVHVRVAAGGGEGEGRELGLVARPGQCLPLGGMVDGVGSLQSVGLRLVGVGKINDEFGVAWHLSGRRSADVSHK